MEGVVAASIRPNTVEIYRRFALLWHLSRELPSPHQTLDLCLFKMVAGLDSDRGAVRALCHRWVEHCLSRGDCGRLLEPIFLSLLAPSTARVSVLHATISQQEEHSKETSTPRAQLKPPGVLDPISPIPQLTYIPRSLRNLLVHNPKLNSKPNM